jgi:hypothetical protein
MYAMVLLGDEAHVDARFCLLQDSANLNTDRCIACTDGTIVSEKSFWTQPIELLSDMGHVKSCFSPFGDGASVGAR